MNFRKPPCQKESKRKGDPSCVTCPRRKGLLIDSKTSPEKCPLHPNYDLYREIEREKAEKENGTQNS